MKPAYPVLLGLMTLAAGCRTPDTASGVKDANAALPASSSDWCHAPQMRSTDATNVNFDYQVKQLGGSSEERSNLADAAWVNVSKFGFNGTESVRAVVTSYSLSTKDLQMGPNLLARAHQNHSQQVDMRWDANAQKFTGQVQGGVNLGNLTIGDDQSFPEILQFSVTVNGTWITDPISGGHNFQFFPFQQAQGICSGNWWNPGQNF